MGWKSFAGFPGFSAGGGTVPSYAPGAASVCLDRLPGRALPARAGDEAASRTPEPAVPVSPHQATTPADRPKPPAAKPDKGKGKPERRVKLTRAVDLGSRQVEWLWPGRVPLGLITMFAGDPKLLCR